MSWLDDHSVATDDTSSYDPAQPIEREFVLAPAWRSLKASLGGMFKKREPIVVEPEYPYTARIFEPEYPAAAEAEVARQAAAPYEPTAAWRHPESREFGALVEPAAQVIEPSEPPTGLEKAFACEESASVPEPVSHHLQPVVVATPEVLEVLATPEPPLHSCPPQQPAEAPVEEIPASSLEVVAPHENLAPVPAIVSALPDVVASEAGPRTPKIVAAAVKVDTWTNNARSRVIDWKDSLAPKRGPRQQELFAIPKRSKRDHLWAQTTVAAAAIALAFLMGWIVASSHRPASNPDQANVPSENTGVGGTTLAPAGSLQTTSGGTKLVGTTVQAGGTTVKAGGVTLSPTAPAPMISPIRSQIEPDQVSKPSPVPRHTGAKSSGHLRRSIDASEGEVVVHHYPAKNLASDKQQTAQLKKYSDKN